jgi:hypothetical protein
MTIFFAARLAHISSRVAKRVVDMRRVSDSRGVQLMKAPPPLPVTWQIYLRRKRVAAVEAQTAFEAYQRAKLALMFSSYTFRHG